MYFVKQPSTHTHTHAHIHTHTHTHTHTVDCGDPGDVENAMRMGNSFLYGNNVTYICDDGYYQSSGPEGGIRTCLETGLWSDQPPECTGSVLST